MFYQKVLKITESNIMVFKWKRWTYTIENQNKEDRGTIISLNIKKDAEEFLR